MVFGIKAYICSSTPDYYLINEDGLLDWLLADNGRSSGLSNMRLVPAPPGYEFRSNPLNGDDESIVEGLYVSVTSPRKDKACQLLPILPRVEEAEFEALGLDEANVMTIYV
jgi:hypothetical protein